MKAVKQWQRQRRQAKATAKEAEVNSVKDAE